MNPWITLFLASLGILIAYRQWATADQRLRMDLFDKRFTVYAATREFLRSIVASGKVEDNELTKFYLATGEAKWLFNEEVARFIHEEISFNAQELQSWNNELEDLEVGPKRNENLREQKILKKWLFASRKVLEEKCTPFLTIEQESLTKRLRRRWRQCFGLPSGG